MNYRKYSINTLLLGLIALFTHAEASLPIPTQLKQCSSYIKQRTQFSHVFIRAIWNFATRSNNNYTLVEAKLAQAYLQSLDDKESLVEHVTELKNALLNNPFISILPEDFFLGASSSALQMEGGLDDTSACARYFRSVGLTTAGDSLDFYNRYATYIQQMKNELHINSFRISIAWNRIQPKCGIYIKEAINFYRDVILILLQNGITPIIVFHHYDIPCWFEDLGGFEKEKNGHYFKEFCVYFYKELAEELGECLISMCNAPEGPAFKGYFTGESTPGEKDNLHKTHTVIANMYYELVDTALTIRAVHSKLQKSNPTLKVPRIGTQLNILPLDPHQSSQANWKDRIKTALGCEIASYIQTGGTYKFLVSGEYRMFTPAADFMKQARGVNVYRYHPYAYKAFDWIGVNIYSNNFLQGFQRINGKDLIEDDEERYTDNSNYRNYPEGIYRAVAMISKHVTEPLGKRINKDGKPLPIIITENGIATKDDNKRTRYFQRALCTITELIKDGYNVIGYLPWTSHDNYEWPTIDNPEGFNSKCYGFFAINYDKHSPNYLESTLKKGSQYYADFAQEFFKQA